MANALTALGLKKGDRVGMALPNCPQYVIAYYAILSAGGIVVNMNPLYTHDELKFMMENSGLETLFTFDMVLPTMQPLARELGLKRVIVTKVTDYINGFGVSDAKSMNLEEGWYHFLNFWRNTRTSVSPGSTLHPRTRR
jgi:long-chain acyl-CoA synthetase